MTHSILNPPPLLDGVPPIKFTLIGGVGEPPVSGEIENVGCGELRRMKDMNHVCHDPDNFPLHVDASSIVVLHDCHTIPLLILDASSMVCELQYEPVT